MFRHLFAGSMVGVLAVSAPPGLSGQRAAERHGAPVALDSGATVEMIARLERAWAEGLVARDSNRLDSLLAPDFALLVSASADRPYPRAVWFAQLREYRTQALTIRDLQVRPIGPDAAVASFIADLRATVREADRSGAFFITDIWRRQPDGRWQAVARFSSRPEAASASNRVLREQSEMQHRP